MRKLKKPIKEKLPLGIWIKPVGKGGENPSDKLVVPARKVKS